MKKLLIFILFIIFTIALCSHVNAKVTGVCSNCHTMHNSMGGGDMAQELSGSGLDLTWADDATPNPSLLMYSCVGCHTNLGTTTITADNEPIVFNTDSPDGPLAGGNFYYVLNAGDNRGHNVLNIVGQGALGLNPPGGSALLAQLRCAGTYGCHGNRGATDQVDAMKEAHHTDDSGGITGGSVGLSYRFLNGILGTEDTDWEQDNTNASHNEYKGSTSSTTDTISYLCANCHGKFHTWQGGASEVGTASPWLRHPTDKVLNSSGEYSGYTTYSLLAPVARPTPGASSSTVTPGTDIIMCLSCHRAHGSPYYKMMRWDYASSTLLSETPVPTDALYGCIICHTTKN